MRPWVEIRGSRTARISRRPRFDRANDIAIMVKMEAAATGHQTQTKPSGVGGLIVARLTTPVVRSVRIRSTRPFW